MGNRKQILGFEIWNRQKDYALCLEIIRFFENIVMSDEIIGEISEISKDLNIWICDIETAISPRYFEEPLPKRDIKTRKVSLTEGLKNKQWLGRMADSERISQLHKLLSNQENLFYYIRVHTQKDKSWDREIVNFQYLALLLHRVSKWDRFGNKKTIKKLTVFLVPLQESKYPFKLNDDTVDKKVYESASQYLRLLSKQYTGVIYSATGDERTQILPLNFRRAETYKTNFPLIPIEDKRYEELFQDNAGIYSALFKLSKNRRFGNAASDNPLEAVRDFAAETSFRRLQVVLLEEAAISFADKLNQIEELILKSSDRSVITFALFSFTLVLNREESQDTFKNKIRFAWYRACELSGGIRQIVQNALQHSQFHECFFSFCLHVQKENETVREFVSRIGKDYPDTVLTKKGGEKKAEALEIFVSDLNEKECMLDRFKANLAEEYAKSAGIMKLNGHKKLLDNSERLHIDELFSEFDDDSLMKGWGQFRQEDLAGHLGLSLFAVVADQYKASVKVISSKEGLLSNYRQYFYKSYSSGEKTSNIEERTVPGTQFSILIPVQEGVADTPVKLGQLQTAQSVKEDYESYAEYFDYAVARDSLPEYAIPDMAGNTLFTDAGSKYNLVLMWYRFWKEYFIKNMTEEESVIVCDFDENGLGSRLDNSDKMEVCLKGFVGALSVVSQRNIGYYLALINVPENSLKMMRNILSLLGAREFPSNLQVWLCGKQYDYAMTLLGDTNFEVWLHAYVLSMEHGLKGIDQGEYERTLRLRERFEKLLPRQAVSCAGDSKNVFPFEVILEVPGRSNTYFFEERIKHMAENPLAREPVGYKLEHTHMRLGSKIHIESFYEMSFLFYRTAIANRISFSILRDLKKENYLDLLNDEVLFYGYASYSKAILTSITEILRMYRKKRKEGTEKSKGVGFVSYQHNLQSESEAIQMYFNLPEEFPGEVVEYNNLKLRKKIKIIQIIPINATLNTFDKMWCRLCNATKEASRDNLELKANYTLFWVSEEPDRESGNCKIEEKYLKLKKENNGSRKQKRVETKFQSLGEAGCPHIDYFIKAYSRWHEPLLCSLCYPEYVVDEAPLIETDSTSTVPAQQIRFREHNRSKARCDKSKEKVNNERLLELENCVCYGHIVRRQNHYQYYIDTQKFFYRCKDNIMRWLKGIKMNKPVDTPVLHIIFSPEHNTNVGFAQYVNTYCFGGLAEIISINIDKEFRSNFKCEHYVIIELIRELYRNAVRYKEAPVKFYFVDDTIISGETFEKAKSFLHSLFPEGIKQNFPANLFEKVFLLMDRMSEETKQKYVQNIEENFLSYVHIDISNMRNQGDSCVGCKLEKQADRMFKRSPTKRLAENWAHKCRDYQVVLYDDLEKMEKQNGDSAYKRLLISHVLQNLIVKNDICLDDGDVFDMILELANYFLEIEEGEPGSRIKKYHMEIQNYGEILELMRGVEGIELLLKAVCRPFFSFDFRIKQQVFALFIVMSEFFLGAEMQEILPENQMDIKNAGFLYKDERLKRLKRLTEKIKLKLTDRTISDFIMHYLLEGLTDMGSNYLIRRQTIERMYLYMKEKTKEEQEEFWKECVNNVYRLISNSSDETKELWLECICLSGKEYSELYKEKGSNSIFTPCFLFNSIVSSENNEAEKNIQDNIQFYQFCHELFLVNTGVYFDGIEALKNGKNNDGEHALDYWKMMIGMDGFQLSLKEEDPEPCELQLFGMLAKNQMDEEEQGRQQKSVKEWYAKLLEKLKNLIQKQARVRERGIKIALLTEDTEKSSSEDRLQNMDFVEASIQCYNEALPEEKYKIKSHIIHALDHIEKFNLKERGYVIIESEETPYIILLFDNPATPFPDKETVGRKMIDIGNVYLYIGIDWRESYQKMDENKQSFALKFILRTVLTYRNRILRMLEQDFSGDIFSKYAHTIGEKNILSHEKALSHSTISDDKIGVEIFTDPDLFIKDEKRGRQVYDAIDELSAAKWLLLRNYVNGQIAKLFTRGFSDNKKYFPKTTPLYVSPVNKDTRDTFRIPLCKFSDLGLGIEKPDGRMEWIKTVTSIEDSDVQNAEFICGANEEKYNLEYFKCILIDIFISAIKYESNEEDFLLRINDFMRRKERLKKLKDITMFDNHNPEETDAADKYEKGSCRIWIRRNTSTEGEDDYLVILNTVDMVAHELEEWKIHNRIIEKRLSDPLDFVDGHMSLLAIKRYIENLKKDSSQKCQFRYVESQEIFEKYQIKISEDVELFFETRLPVLRRR